jgi:hypothetical protein
VQDRTNVDANGRFQEKIYLGDAKPEPGASMGFEIRAFSPSNPDLSPGMTVYDWPDAALQSQSIQVRRNDLASDGCDIVGNPPASLGNIPPNEQSKFQPSTIPQIPGGDLPGLRSARIEGTSSLSGISDLWHLNRGLVLLVISTSLILLGPLFLALSAFPVKTEARAAILIGWIEKSFDWLCSVCRFMITRAPAVWSLVAARSKFRAKQIWNNRGFEGSFRKFFISTILLPLLLAAGIGSFYADAKVIVKGLGVLFGVQDQDTTDQDHTGAFDDISGPPTQANKAAPQEQTITTWLKDKTMGLLSRFAAAFENLWENKIGYLGQSLAGLQAAFGIILFWEFSRKDAAEAGPWKSMMRPRLFLLLVFLILISALSFTAGIRGYTKTHSSYVGSSMVLSAALAAVLPWILIVCWHFVIECAADVLSIAYCVFLMACIFIGSILLLAACSVFGLFVILLAACAFALIFLPSGSLWAYFQVARVQGELGRSLQIRLWPNPGSKSPAVIVILLLIMIFIISGMLFYMAVPQ